jgi:methylenetetrahydrofolate reductase (NADPH)
VSETVQIPEASVRRRPTAAPTQFGEIYRGNAGRGHLTVSFELFPPRSADDDRTLFEKTLPQLMERKPAFFTVTYGAGGSTRERTLEIAARVKRETGLPVAAHLACIGATVEQLESFLSAARDAGIDNIVAVRGDRPKDHAEAVPAPGAPRYASELVALVKRSGPFAVAVGGYPEGHTECVGGREADWARTREKVDAGADIVITQLFYDNRDFYAFEGALRTHGVKVPVVPGVLPILSTPQIKRFAGMCGATLPPALLARLDAVADDAARAAEIGVEHAIGQCREMLRHGVVGFHFYTLNRAAAVSAILSGLEA